MTEPRWVADVIATVDCHPTAQRVALLEPRAAVVGADTFALCHALASTACARSMLPGSTLTIYATWVVVDVIDHTEKRIFDVSVTASQVLPNTRIISPPGPEK